MASEATKASPPRVVINLSQGEKKKWEKYAYKDGLDSSAAWVKRLVRLHIRGREEKMQQAGVRPPEPKW
jgi:hypothetical protein